MKNTCNHTFFCWFYQYHTEPLLIFDPALALSWQLFLFFYIEIIWRLLTVYSSKMYKNVVVRPMGFSFWSFFVFVVFFSSFCWNCLRGRCLLSNSRKTLQAGYRIDPKLQDHTTWYNWSLWWVEYASYYSRSEVKVIPSLRKALKAGVAWYRLSHRGKNHQYSSFFSLKDQGSL